jgi:hypothetical protein
MQSIYRLCNIILIIMQKTKVDKLTTVALHESTCTRLKRLGKMGESFDALINRILDEYNVDNNKKEK